MYNFLTKKGTTVAFLVGVILIVAYLVFATTGMSGAGYEAGTDLVEIFKKDGSGDLNFFNFGIKAAVAMVFIAFILAFVVFGLMGIVKFPKNSVKSLAGVVVLAILFVVFRSSATVEDSGRLGFLHEKFEISPEISTFISGGIMTTVTLIAIAAIVIVLSEVRNAFK